MNLSKAPLRKIIIGESFSKSIKYQKDSTYKLPMGDCTLTDLIPNTQDETLVDVYLAHNGSKFLWKSISTKLLLEVEYDSNFQ